MASRRQPDYPLIVIVGPTASGKTGLAIRIAQKYGGEVISADSRAVYRGLSIGTAKPTIQERQSVAHWGIDIVDPGERFTAAEFQRYALRKIEEIRLRDRLPILVGGTGLYIDAVVYKFDFPTESNDIDRRDQLAALTIEQLHLYCLEHNIILPQNEMNKRHVVSVILRNGRDNKSERNLNKNTIVVGITTEKNVLQSRIKTRVEEMFNQPVVEEALRVAEEFGWNNEAMTGNVYPLIHQLVDDGITLDRAKELAAVQDWKLAKRQLTWFKRNNDVRWFTLEDAYTFVAHRLDKLNKS